MSTTASQATASIRRTHRFFIAAQWVAPSFGVTIQVIEPGIGSRATSRAARGRAG